MYIVIIICYNTPIQVLYQIYNKRGQGDYKSVIVCSFLERQNYVDVCGFSCTVLIITNNR